MAAGFNLAEQNHAKYTKQHFWPHGLYSPKHAAHPYFTILEPRHTVQTTHQEVFNHKNLQKIITGRPSWDARSWVMELPNSPDKNIYKSVMLGGKAHLKHGVVLAVGSSFGLCDNRRKREESACGSGSAAEA